MEATLYRKLIGQKNECHVQQTRDEADRLLTNGIRPQLTKDGMTENG